MDYHTIELLLMAFVCLSGGIMAGAKLGESFGRAWRTQLEDDKKELKESLEKSHLFNDVFIKRFHGYTRHDHGCTYDDLSKGDVCTCGLQGLINLYYDLKDSLEEGE